MSTATRLLVVDDERNMRNTLRDILEDEGYCVETAESGEAAVDACRRDQFDLVLMDIRMPGIDGVEAYRRMRGVGASAPVILMSAYPAEDVSPAAMAEGVTAFLPKPLNIESVVHLIERHCPGTRQDA